MSILDRTSGVSLYMQIKNLILNRIASGMYMVDGKIDTERKFCEELKVGRPTVRQAINELVHENILEPRKGSGIYVISRPKEIDLFSCIGATEAFRNIKGNFHTSVLKVCESDQFPLSFFSSPGHEFVHLERLRKLDKAPVVWERTLINRDIVPGLKDIDLNQKSLVQTLNQKYMLKLGTVYQYFSVVPPDAALNKIFKKSQQALLYVEREIELNNERGHFYSQLCIDTSEYRFYQIVVPPKKSWES